MAMTLGTDSGDGSARSVLLSARGSVAPDVDPSPADDATASDGVGAAWLIGPFVASLTAASVHTVAAYRGDVRDFAAWAERGVAAGPASVDRTLLRRYVAFLTTRRYAKRTVARKVAALRRYFRWLHRAGHLPVDPSASLHAPSGEGRLPRVLDAHEIDHLLDAPADEDEPIWRRLRDDAVLELLYGSGIRVSELCAIDVDHPDLARGVVTVWGKGSKQRQVPLSATAVEALRGWSGVRGDVVPVSAGSALFGNVVCTILTQNALLRWSMAST